MRYPEGRAVAGLVLAVTSAAVFAWSSLHAWNVVDGPSLGRSVSFLIIPFLVGVVLYGNR